MHPTLLVVHYKGRTRAVNRIEKGSFEETFTLDVQEALKKVQRGQEETRSNWIYAGRVLDMLWEPAQPGDELQGCRKQQDHLVLGPMVSKDVETQERSCAAQSEGTNDKERLRLAAVLSSGYTLPKLIVRRAVEVASGTGQEQDRQRNWLLTTADMADAERALWLREGKALREGMTRMETVKEERIKATFELAALDKRNTLGMPTGTRWWVIMLEGEAHL